METLAVVEGNDEQQINESLDGRNSSSLSSPKEIADPIVYKLVRVEGDGRLVPATNDEVMEVEDLLEDDRSELPLVPETGQAKGCILKDGLLPLRNDIEGSKGISQSENAEVKVQKLNARLEYIGVMLQKVKQEERLRLSSGSPDHSSSQMKLDAVGSDQSIQFPTNGEKPPTVSPSLETVPVLSPRLNDNDITQLGSETCSKPADMSKVAGSSSSASATFSSSMPDFSKIKGEICLDNLSIKELHETFWATFGRQTTVKDKLWLKRRIAMGLTNSCDVSTSTFIIKDKTLIKKKEIEEEASKGASKTVGISKSSCKDSSVSPTTQMGDRQVSGKRSRKAEAEDEYICEDPQTEPTGSKRVRKPTKRYIEELSDIDTRECSGKLSSSVKTSGHYQPDPKPHARPVRNVALDGRAVVTRQESLGGSGVQVPFVSRVRRGRPRENFMPLMKYHPSTMDMAAKLVKKGLGVRVSRPDRDDGEKDLKVILPPKQSEQPIAAETRKEDKEEKEKHNDAETCFSGQQQPMEMENVDLSGDITDHNVTTMSSTKGGPRRKHHRAWTLSEVINLVEGVSRYGAGRWSEIKRLAFASYTYRTSVDLKDKWRNLLRASFAQSPTDKGIKNSRKHATMPIPVSILLRVRELAEKHSQAAPELCSSGGNSAGISVGRSSVNETRSGFL